MRKVEYNSIKNELLQLLSSLNLRRIHLKQHSHASISYPFHDGRGICVFPIAFLLRVEGSSNEEGGRYGY